ncbi:helix-turn-helix transcriptional regulator [Aquimarina sp. MMG015]|uniref:PadR family transcriptional regulator n=1 Tax=Aquimarina TaxID=290174 RepID=UPI0004835550|nr:MULTISPECIES: PadR family transcriptional regulator [Aquimarina]AXT56128.1 PadR family transcriptional regulator [Aquimarina sp. AD1]MBQ4803776.1 helix-turn-helix transcriptional regulator [Aquimarina sp. MMG015]RKN21964.1 PadR family transcriptional regulator [Aquimarina sp. AD1]
MYSKELLKGTLSVIILNLLSEKGRMYGYEIFQQVKERSDGKILLKDGSLYPALQKMKKEGLLSCEEEYIGKRIRKYYLLTSKGKEEKVNYIEELKDFMETLNKVIFPKLDAI